MADVPAPKTPTAHDDPTAALVVKRWTDSDKKLLRERKDYWLNCAFFEGRQWIYWDDRKRIIQNTFQPSKYENQRMRVTINKIMPRINTLMGRFCQRDLSFEGQPSDTDDATIGKSKLSETIIESRRSDLDWEATRADAVMAALMGGTSAICYEWNGAAGNELWVDSQSHQVVGEGEVQLTPFSIAEFSLEPGVRHTRDARWWVSCVAMPPESVKALYSLDWTPKADATAGTGSAKHQVDTASVSGERPELASVYCMYEKPNTLCPKGKHAIVVNDRTVSEEDWPFESKELNVYVFRTLEVPGRWTGITMMTAARVPQMLYNIARSTIAEHVKLAAAVKLLAAHGALDDDTEITDEPGEVLSYWAGPDQPQPQYLNPPVLGRFLMQTPEEMEAELDDILHSHAVSRGEAPGDRNSGLALSILAEKNDTPLGPMARDQAKGWGWLGTQSLRLYSTKAVEKRVAITMSPHGVPDKREWSGDMIGDQYRVSVPLEAVMPTSKAATQAMVIQAAQTFPVLGQMPLETLLKSMEIPGLRALDSIGNSDASRAIYENERMATGDVMVPRKWDDHGRHISEHNAFRNSNGWDGYDEDTQAIFEAHILSHQRLVEEEAQSQAALNQIRPGLAGLPQANNPIGSAIPPPVADMPMGGAPAPTGAAA